jgi:phosphoglycerate dehydrogenase-like enzyme
MIGLDDFKAMKDPSFLINTARGEIVKIEELIEALEQMHLAGAGIDVYPEEPFNPSPESLPDNLITTPHTAGFGPGLLSDLVDEIIDACSKRFAVSVETVSTAEEDIAFKLPRELRDAAP